MISTRKKFPEWLKLKSRIHFSGKLPHIKEGEVWWAAIGENVGIEINGKSNRFSRPVLIFKKLGQYGFMAIPLTSQHHEGSWYVSLDFLGKRQYIVLAQVRVLSVSRSYSKIGQLSNLDFKKVKQGFAELYVKNIP